MVSFVVYDLAFLVLFTLFVVWFLYRNKKKLQREGIIYMYKTQLGIRAINYVGEKYKKVLHVLKYVIIAVGFALMAAILYVLGQALYIYIKFPQITDIVKAPPIAPLIPYFPKIFGLQSFFPPFYFTYFLIALLVVAVVHEFAHGIYMKLFKIKIKSTGFVFLGPILGAFVEEDKNNFEKKKKIEQMSVLGAGVFANLIFALIFFGLLVGFFALSFVPAGYQFNSYAYSIVPRNLISEVEDGNLTKVSVGDNVYFLDDELKGQLEQNLSHIFVYEDAPAIKVGLKGIIVQMDDVKIKEQEDIRVFLENKNPGDEVVVKTIVGEEKLEFNLILGEHPADNTKPYMGIAFVESKRRGVVGAIMGPLINFKEASTYYEPKWDGDFVIFIYNLLWWVALINFFVALFNMLPLGILDGGRFFYLTVWGLTGSEKVGKKAFKLITYLILLLFLLMLFFWFFALI